MSSMTSLSLWVEEIQSKGRYTFTRAEAESGAWRSFLGAQSALRRWKELGRHVSPRRGRWKRIARTWR
jgi:hypothetical protein